MSPPSPRTRRVAATTAAALAVLVALVPAAAAAGGRGSAPTPKPDPDLQARIEQAVAAVVSEPEAAAERIEGLREAAKGRREALLLQLALYLEAAPGTEQSMAGALIVDRLAFTAEEKLEAVVPRLETPRSSLRRVFTELLSTIDRPQGGEPDYRPYEAWIAKNKASPPPALIRYIYEVSPDAALRSMARLYGDDRGGATTAPELDDMRDLLARHRTSPAWSSRDRARAQAALETLSRDPAWWVRRYAAAIVIAVPDLATPDLRRRIENDPEPLVRDALSR